MMGDVDGDDLDVEDTDDDDAADDDVVALLSLVWLLVFWNTTQICVGFMTFIVKNEKETLKLLEILWFLIFRFCYLIT